MSEGQRLQAQQADAALEEFKRQVELNSEKVYAEMKEQVRGCLWGGDVQVSVGSGMFTSSEGPARVSPPCRGRGFR